MGHRLAVVPVNDGREARSINGLFSDQSVMRVKATYAFAVDGRLDGISRIHGQVWIAAAATVERVLVLFA